MVFCTKCKNLVVKKEMNNKIIHYCETCDKQYDIKNKILESYSSSFKDEINIKIKRAILSDIYAKKYIKCPSCKHHIAKYFKDKKTMKNTYICIVCNSYWNNS